MGNRRLDIENTERRRESSQNSLGLHTGRHEFSSIEKVALVDVKDLYLG